VKPSPSLGDIRAHAKRQREQLPEALHRLDPRTGYAVTVADDLMKLAADVDLRLHKQATMR
jgi:hypothetical protein